MQYPIGVSDGVRFAWLFNGVTHYLRIFHKINGKNARRQNRFKDEQPQ